MVGAYIELSLDLLQEVTLKQWVMFTVWLVLNIRDSDLFKAGYVPGVSISILAH